MVVSLAEKVFQRQAELAQIFQDSAFASDEYQEWRSDLVRGMNSQIVALNDELISVRHHRREVEKFRRIESFTLISDIALAELKKPISMLVINDKTDVDALKFDSLMYGYMVELCSGRKATLYRNNVLTIVAELEHIFTHELGNAEDYARTYGDTPFGLLVRKLVHLDRDAAMEAFSEFLNDQSLNEQQISFVKRVVDYVVENGYMEPVALTQPPFDRPCSFMQIFDQKRATALVALVKTIKQNAVSPAA